MYQTFYYSCFEKYAFKQSNLLYNKYRYLNKPDFDNWIKYFKPVFELKKSKDKLEEENLQLKHRLDKLEEMMKGR